MQPQSIIDWLMVIPVAILAATWWLPWGKLPARFLGPLCLLVAFVLWRYGVRGWVVPVYAIAGFALSTYAVVKHRKTQNAKDT
jgi:TctA family transporter